MYMNSPSSLSPFVIHFNYLVGHDKREKMKVLGQWFTDFEDVAIQRPSEVYFEPGGDEREVQPWPTTEKGPEFPCDYDDKVHLWLDWPFRTKLASFNISLSSFTGSWVELRASFDDVFYEQCIRHVGAQGMFGPRDCLANLQQQLFHRMAAICEAKEQRQNILESYFVERSPCKRMDGATVVNNSTIADESKWLRLLHHTIIPSRENASWFRHYDDLARFVVASFPSKDILSRPGPRSTRPVAAVSRDQDSPHGSPEVRMKTVTPAEAKPGDSFEVETPSGDSINIEIPEGFEGGSDIDFFVPRSYAHRKSPLRILEVGTTYGGLSSRLLSWFPTAHLFSVDPFIVELEDAEMEEDAKPLADAVRAELFEASRFEVHTIRTRRPSPLELYERLSRRWATALHYDHLRQGFGCRYHLFREPPMKSTAGRFADRSLDVVIVNTIPAYLTKSVINWFLEKVLIPGGIFIFVGYTRQNKSFDVMRSAVDELADFLGVEIQVGASGVPPGEGNAAIVMPFISVPDSGSDH